MNSELSFPYQFVGHEEEKPTTVEPFFVATTIPFPDIQTPTDTTAFNDLRDHWDLATEDFMKIYETNGFGDQIRDFFRDTKEGGQFTLLQLGELVGIDSPMALRKVRSTLALGTTDHKTHETYWNFSQLELSQFLVGLIGKRHRNIYTRINTHRKAQLEF